ncbi:MAG: pilus assembly protein [Alphaproteobacteria bacterium]|nr:pilus assembly protein [Alphaproteobacteria bacterium]
MIYRVSEPDNRIHLSWKRSRAFARDENGVTLIEFGLLALPFFSIIGAILETAIVFFAAQVLDSAVGDAARLVRTGQAATQSYTLSEFREVMCGNSFGMFNCADFKLRVSEISTFNAADFATPLDSDSNWVINETYTSGQGKSVMFIEVYYKWPVIMNLFGFNLSTESDNTRLLSAARVFKNEPF